MKEIKSIEEFLNAAFEIQEEAETHNESCETDGYIGLAFRGHSNKYYELMPSIGRRENSSCHLILNQERNLIEMAKYKLPNVFKSDLSPIDLLSLLQHYGIPTRLLDVTSNPLVALYFASLDDSTDGEVIVFEYSGGDITNYPVFNAIAETYKFAFGTFHPLDIFFSNIIEQPYFLEQKSEFAQEDRKRGAQWIKDCCKELIFVNSTERIERQKLQQGFYILFPNKIDEYGDSYCFSKEILPIDKNGSQIKVRYIIKKEGKAELRKKLEFLGISESALFADNIDIVCKNIVEQCKKRKC